jgi:hypothetical protein
MPRTRIRDLNRLLGRPGSPVEEQRNALIALLERSLHLGHSRLALRRYYMLRECSHRIPADLAEACRILTLRYPPADLEKIRNPAVAWATMIGRMPALGDSPGPRTTWIGAGPRMAGAGQQCGKSKAGLPDDH